MKWNVGDCSLRRSIGTVDHRTKMTGDESRELEIGDRVCWGTKKNDQGTVIGTVWNEIIIDWDDGHTISIQHNDMARVERAQLVPGKRQLLQDSRWPAAKPVGRPRGEPDWEETVADKLNAMHRQTFKLPFNRLNRRGPMGLGAQNDQDNLARDHLSCGTEHLGRRQGCDDARPLFSYRATNGADYH
jgi:hypothetical protein